MRVFSLFIFLSAISLTLSAQRPNIVIVMADDLDSRQLSCYGGTNIRTTNIDQLAGQGLRFSNLIASEAMCIPTRASLFTGLYPVRHGAFQNHKSVYDSLKSVGHYLSDLGYHVALTGKNHVTAPKSVFPFTIVEGFEPNCVSPTDDYDLSGIRNFITGQKKPFCLFVMSINPHAPWTVGDPSEFDPAELDLPADWVDTPETRVAFQKYLAEVRRLDNQVGDIEGLLKELKIEENTVLIFLGEQGAQFPGAKWTLWDAGQRSSMIVRWPDRIKPDTETQAIVQYEDITPTLIDIAGGSPLMNLDGKSFLPVLLDRTSNAREVAYGIHNNIPAGSHYPSRSIRDQQYKLILNLSSESEFSLRAVMGDNPAPYWLSWLKKAEDSPSDKNLIDRFLKRPPVEFYDLQKDPSELNNLAANPENKPLIDKYKMLLTQWMVAQGDEGAKIDKLYNKKGGKH